MKYKITRRGWIVIVVLIILVLVSSISLISKFVSPNDNSNTESTESSTNVEEENSNEALVDESSEVNSEESTDESSEVTEFNSEESTDESSEATEANSEEGTDEAVEVNIEGESKYDFESFILTIYYDKNEFSLNKDYYESLNDVIDMMSFNKLVNLAIEGHINGFPDYIDGEYGLSISLNRANVVKAYLVEAGVSEDRISIINKGSSDQISISEDLSKHYLNRRAYLYFINK